MKTTLFLLFLVLTGCDEGVTGVCNVCPSATFVDLDACEDQAEALGCATAEVVSVSGDDCAVGQPPRTYQACVYTDCDEPLDCTLIADR